MVIAAVRRLQPAEKGEAEADGEAMIDAKDVKLTSFTRGLGCACKLRPQALQQVLQGLGTATDPALLVGTSTGDDAAVYQGAASVVCLSRSQPRSECRPGASRDTRLLGAPS